MFYDRTRKRGPFYIDECLIELPAWAGLTVFISQDKKRGPFNTGDCMGIFD